MGQGEQQVPINRRMGGAGGNGGNKIGVLENMQEMISLAKSEVGVLRELARNVTDSGKELNLWEILDAVNATVSDNPNSGIAKLMKRFYANYLADENEPQLNDRPTPGTYEKSLSSLIFLSFGIFLLNSVNEHLTQNVSEDTKRSLENYNNDEANLGGRASSVAKINSVGMKLVLERMPGSGA